MRDRVTVMDLPLRAAVVEELYGLPEAGVVGSYGGGDAMMMSRQLLVKPLPPAAVPPPLRARVAEEARAALERHTAVPEGDRVARLPDPAGALRRLSEEGGDALAWGAHLQLSSHVYGAGARANLMYHGWLFATDARDPECRGRSRWPLVGLFSPARGVAPAAGGGPAALAVDALAPADQHIHKVDDLAGRAADAWHFGSDMAAFDLDPNEPLCGGWAVCVDLDRMRCDATLLYVVRGDLEAPAEAALEATAHGLDLALTADALAAALGDAAPAGALDELHAVARRCGPSAAGR